MNLLARLFAVLNQLLAIDDPIRDLFMIAFCRLLIETSNAAFNHQSMSFRQPSSQQLSLFAPLEHFLEVVHQIIQDASSPLLGTVRVDCADARQRPFDRAYDALITSPPYPNRMSYIRELRPYMYWLGYLTDARQAGELDWQAIGGTWGIATSRLADWTSTRTLDVPSLSEITRLIAGESSILANYVHKYFVDMQTHFENAFSLVRDGGSVSYVIGNSKFYDTLVPTERLFADQLRLAGFTAVRIECIRKRNSKKELFEYLVSGVKPS